MMGTSMTPAVARGSILLIEDEPSVAAFLRTALERRGYEIECSASATDGLHLLATRDFHDWLMRHRPELASRIIFITGDTASAETVALLARNGTPCVEKPFRIHQLMEAVEKTIGKP
jgi:DNA-binding response OmpR family regulator